MADHTEIGGPESKVCVICGATYFKGVLRSRKKWQSQRGCSPKCGRAVMAIRQKATAMVRFWKMVTVDPSGCWLWGGCQNGTGYGQFRLNDSNRLTHRIVYELNYGAIPNGLEIDHLCRVRACCNPTHLEAVDHRTNALRGVGISAIYAARTHCKQGHILGGENTLPYRGRSCRVCAKAAMQQAGKRRTERERAAR